MPPCAAALDPFHELTLAYPAFRALPDPLVARVGRALRRFEATRGHHLPAFHPGDVPFVLDGRLQILLGLANGRRVPLYALGRGDWCVVALAHTDGHPVSHLDAVAVTDVRGVRLSSVLLRQCLDADHALWMSAFDVVTARLVDLTEAVARRSTATVDQRLAALLLARGPAIQTTHQGLADELGTAREVVSRALEHFAAEGLIRLRRAHIDVADPRGLAAYEPREVD